MTVALVASLALAGPSPTSTLEPSALGPVVGVTLGDLNKGEVVGIVDAPLGAVLAVVRDCDGTADWFPDLVGTHVVGESGGIVDCAGRTRLPFPLPDRRWEIQVSSEQFEIDGVETWTVAFQYLHGSGNVDEMYGGYHLQPVDGGRRTLVVYEAWVDIGFWVPAFVEKWATERALPGVIEGLEREATRRMGPISALTLDRGDRSPAAR